MTTSTLELLIKNENGMHLLRPTPGSGDAATGKEGFIRPMLPMTSRLRSDGKSFYFSLPPLIRKGEISIRHKFFNYVLR